MSTINAKCVTANLNSYVQTIMNKFDLYRELTTLWLVHILPVLTMTFPNS